MKKHHKFSHSHVEWHHDGSATVHHQHSDGPAHDKKHAAADLDSVHDSLQDHMGGPETDGDQALDRGEHGIPAEQASSAGIPAGPMGPVGA